MPPEMIRLTVHEGVGDINQTGSGNKPAVFDRNQIFLLLLRSMI